MRQLFFKYFLQFFLALNVLIFTGCSVDIAQYAGNMNVWDPDATNTEIKTKIINQPFDLNTSIDASTMTTEKYFTGTYSHTIYTGTNALTTTQVIDYGTIQGGTITNITNNFNVSSATKDAFSDVTTCFRSENCTGDRIENEICEQCDGYFFLGSCIGSWIPARWDFATDNDMATCTNACPLVEVCVDSDGYITDADPAVSCLFGTSTGVKLIPCYINHSSTDHFAVRPNKLTITKADGGNINTITSASNLDINITAEDFSGLTTNDYNTSDIINIQNPPLYYKTPTLLDNTATMTGSTSIIINPSFIDGISTNAAIQFDDVGQITIHLQDTTWSAIDALDTPQDCSINGAFICGDINATFIPDSFDYSNLRIDGETSSFTYFSADANNVGAYVTGNVLAKNASGVTTKNYDTDFSWAKDVDLNVTNILNQTVLSNQVTILSTNFQDGNSSIIQTNNVRFNLDRNSTLPLNPTIINIKEVTLTSSSIEVAIKSKLITTSESIDSNTTFLYARSHSPSYRFTASTETALIYYESYCNSTDSRGNACDKNLLPNSSNLNISDDPRWFINPLHTSAMGISGTITQKNAAGLVTSTAPIETSIATATLTYTGTFVPYKTTMQNSASTWLIYNQYNPNATTNEFDVEFEVGLPTGWSGSAKNNNITTTNNTSNGNNIQQVNRRTMW